MLEVFRGWSSSGKCIFEVGMPAGLNISFVFVGVIGAVAGFGIIWLFVLVLELVFVFVIMRFIRSGWVIWRRVMFVFGVSFWIIAG